MNELAKSQRVLFKVFSEHPKNPQPQDRFGHELTGKITVLPKPDCRPPDPGGDNDPRLAAGP